MNNKTLILFPSFHYFTYGNIYLLYHCFLPKNQSNTLRNDKLVKDPDSIPSAPFIIFHLSCQFLGWHPQFLKSFSLPQLLIFIDFLNQLLLVCWYAKSLMMYTDSCHNVYTNRIIQQFSNWNLIVIFNISYSFLYLNPVNCYYNYQKSFTLVYMLFAHVKIYLLCYQSSLLLIFKLSFIIYIFFLSKLYLFILRLHWLQYLHMHFISIIILLVWDFIVFLLQTIIIEL